MIWYTSWMVCDPDPGADERAVEALLKAFPDFSREKALYVVSVVRGGLEAHPLRGQINY